MHYIIRTYPYRASPLVTPSYLLFTFPHALLPPSCCLPSCLTTDSVSFIQLLLWNMMSCPHSLHHASWEQMRLPILPTPTHPPLYCPSQCNFDQTPMLRNRLLFGISGALRHEMGILGRQNNLETLKLQRVPLPRRIRSFSRSEEVPFPCLKNNAWGHFLNDCAPQDHPHYLPLPLLLQLRPIMTQETIPRSSGEGMAYAPKALQWFVYAGT